MNRAILRKWYEEVNVKNEAHRIAARDLGRLYNIIGFTAILSGIIAGYEVIKSNDETIPFWTIILGSFAIIAAVSNAGIKFFGFENKKDLHARSAKDYSTLQHKMEELLMADHKKIEEKSYNDITLRLIEINKKAPILKSKYKKKAKKIIQNEKIIDKTNLYDIQLNEKWKIFIKKPPEDISKNPVRKYVCEPLELTEFYKSNEICISNKHIMKRDGKDISVYMEGKGIIQDNIAYIRYSVTDINPENKTYGNMILDFTNRVYAKGFWMVADVKGADFLIGTIEMNIKK